MASSSRNGERRPVHQDFIARIRFSNALPPPPHPPKLLDIPNVGLTSGQYTSPGFAGRLAREQPLNIEADAELGMPLDLVGMPGIFDGDESSIHAPAQAPPPHPHDKALLRSLAQLGKPKSGDSSVSFLRRTEYIASVSSKSHLGSGGPLRSTNPQPLKRPPKRRSPEPDRDSPAYVKRKIDQGFAVAEQNLKDRSRVRHPSKRNLKLVDAYPLLPDLEAFPDSGAYVTIKFLTNPLPDKTTYDPRMLHGMFRPLEKTEAEEAAIRAMMEAHERDPAHNPKPDNAMNYEFYLPDTQANSVKFGKAFDSDSPTRDDPSLYPAKNGEGKPCFPFQRMRGYETAQETELDHTTKYDDEVLVAYNDEETSLHQKALYFYPVMQRSNIRPQRTKNIARTIVGLADENEQTIDQLHITVDDPPEHIHEQTQRFKSDPYGLAMSAEMEEAARAEAAQHEHHEEHEEHEEHGRRGTSPDEHGEEDGDADADADGDEEE